MKQHLAKIFIFYQVMIRKTLEMSLLIQFLGTVLVGRMLAIFLPLHEVRKSFGILMMKILSNFG